MYDFDSGNLSLDFANTNDWHGSPKPIERLKDYSDLVSWGKQADLIDQESVQRLMQQQSNDPVTSSRAYEQGIQLRETIYRIFSHRYAGKPIPEADLALLNKVVRRAMAHLQVCTKGAGCDWEWDPEVEGINVILYPIARAAAELLTSNIASRVRECEDDRGCGYLFIDQTKNHSRRWCSMESCGNRAKAKRHYSRIQA